MAGDAQANLGRMVGERSSERRDEQPPRAVPAASDPPAPGWLRLARGATGIALLVGAWGASMGALLLGLNVVALAAHSHLVVRVLLYVAGALGIIWLGAMALTALIVGAFCLTLTLRNYGW
jgi:hypothetical protein